MTGLSAENVSFLRHKRPILQSASITVAPGELVALIGPNGAGKSTLLRMLAGELAPHQGCCRLDETDIHRTRAAGLVWRRAVLPQDVTLDFPLRVQDVIALGRAPWRRHADAARNQRAIAEATQAVGATELLARPYDGLSGGERQRVQLARVLAQIWDVHWDHQPRYLLLDEPTASLDIGHQQRLLASARQMLAQGTGILAVLHDLNLAAAYADRLYLLDQGRVAAEGDAASVLRPQALNGIYGARLDVRLDPCTGRPVVLPYTGTRSLRPVCDAAWPAGDAPVAGSSATGSSAADLSVTDPSASDRPATRPTEHAARSA